MTPTPLLQTRSLERRMGDWARARLPFALAELVMFVLKQGWACLFGGLLLAAIIASKLVWQPGWPVHRYDALFSLRWRRRPPSCASGWRPGRRRG